MPISSHHVAKLLVNRILLGWVTNFSIVLICLQIILQFNAFYQYEDFTKKLELYWLQEEGIAILLICFGVVLEGREILLKRFASKKQLDIQHDTNEACEYYGLMLLIIGLVIEVFAVFAHLIDLHPIFNFYSQVCITMPLNLYSVYLLIGLSMALYKSHWIKLIQLWAVRSR
ncbi:hypothetical protein [Catenovulum maritimum]|uniref:Uncharacterized protein n=1 Tax=Catenovulum maritimum TaxID=1513271 RepID=A0A0J8GPB4_9ALTE|nr:hypothetical protein [Catenovulum maritimum]KMT64617.1 hypothetical protein XM47_13320 [Catenovulum maritimum]